ncbi:MAG TPA: hypothetical protein VG297_13440, partial [Bryobacteraceae bacterium]|nr:hypothetical protein [Bryobacteraceae bacterium]
DLNERNVPSQGSKRDIDHRPGENEQDNEQIFDPITFIDRGRIIDSMDKETYLDRWRLCGSKFRAASRGRCCRALSA